MVVWVLTRTEVFMSVVQKVNEWFELMVSCVVKAVVYVLRVYATVLKV